MTALIILLFALALIIGGSVWRNRLRAQEARTQTPEPQPVASPALVPGIHLRADHPTEPVLSCYVKGVIRSITDTPHRWTSLMRYYSRYTCDGIDIDSCPGNERQRPCITLSHCELTTDEEAALKTAYTALVRYHTVEVPERQAASLRKSFEQLGCPPSTLRLWSGVMP